MYTVLEFGLLFSVRAGFNVSTVVLLEGWEDEGGDEIIN